MKFIAVGKACVVGVGEVVGHRDKKANSNGVTCVKIKVSSLNFLLKDLS
jgi:hypothetical protein